MPDKGRCTLKTGAAGVFLALALPGLLSGLRPAECLPVLQTPSVRAHTLADRLVLAYHYPWYGYKETGRWDEKTADHPLIGPYRSDDPRLH